MPLASRPRTVLPGSRSLNLPPPFRLVVLREVGDAFAHACAHAGELGAGTLVFVGRFDLAEAAVVLEPEQPLATARLAFYAGMVALGDALAAGAPPEKPIAIDWPDAIQIDRGLARLWRDDPHGFTARGGNGAAPAGNRAHRGRLRRCQRRGSDRALCPAPDGRD